jgi:hypothetical protein
VDGRIAVLEERLQSENGSRGGRAGGGHLPQLGGDGGDGHAEALDPLAEIGRHAQVHFLTQRPQLRRQRHQRLDIAARADCREQHAHGFIEPG